MSKKKLLLLGLGVFVAISVIGSSSTQQPEGKASPSPTPVSEKPLDANVRFNEESLMVTNKETKDWTDCKLELNSNFSFKSASLVVGDALIIPFSEFTKGDGTRFNVFTTKAQNLYISCQNAGDRRWNYFELK